MLARQGCSTEGLTRIFNRSGFVVEKVHTCGVCLDRTLIARRTEQGQVLR